ncbi:MAG: ZIP family metal transporter [Nanoarchaeota archaeon]
MEAIYALISVFFISLISVIAVIPFLLKKKISTKSLLFLVSLSIGVLLSTVFFNLIPEVFSHDYNFDVAFYILFGFLVMFIIEKFIHFNHKKKCIKNNVHNHAYTLGPINLIGDGIHNFIDGLLIAVSYTVDIVLGITVTISILFHEIPQEIADFGILLYSGFSKLKALLFNFVSALTAVIGALFGIILVNYTHEINHFIIPFAIGNFLYIAASNLVPQLHRYNNIKDSIIHIIAIILGILIIISVTFFLPAHVH